MAVRPTKRRKLSDDSILSEIHQHGKDNGKTLVRAKAPEPTRSLSSDMLHPMDIAGTYHSDIFKLQTDELLAELRPSSERQILAVEKTLRSLEATLSSLPSRDPQLMTDAERSMDQEANGSIPFPRRPAANDVNYQLSFIQPAAITPVGSYALGTAIASEERLVIDVAVSMPSSMFQKNDYLNHRYFHKRAYYLACIASGILKTAKINNIRLHYAFQDENSLQPTILLTPASDDDEDDFARSKCNIRILLCIESELFPLERTLPGSNCVRSPGIDGVPQPSSSPATPFYNATARSDALMIPYRKALQLTSSESEGFRDACRLGALWLRQRGFGSSISQGGFGELEMRLMLSLLTQGGGPKGRPLIFRRFDYYQILKSAFQLLASADLLQNPIVIGSKYPIQFASSDIPMFFDGLKAFNILFKMTRSSYLRLRCEAQTTLQTLRNSGMNEFKSTFIAKVDDPLQQFDCVAQVSIPKLSALTGFDTSKRILDYCGTLYGSLQRGLGDRVDLISVKPNLIYDRPLKNPQPEVSVAVNFSIGLLVNPATAGRTVDHGPSADDKSAAESFREFWGEKAELRRFKDGSILESLVWDDQLAKQSVLQQVITYVLRRHVPGSTVEFRFEDFEHMAPIDGLRLSQPLAPFEESSKSYEKLEKHLRALEGLPLQIRHISAVCPELRYASVLPFSSPASSHSPKPMDITLQFEGSARWPEDISAIQRIKVAFLLKIGEVFEARVQGTETKVGLENETNDLLNSCFLDIVYPNEAAFRLRIHHERELSLLEYRIKDKSSSPHFRRESALAISSYKRQFIQGPLHTQAVRTLCTRFPLLSPSIRLFKTWCEAHLFSTHISSELIELLMIRSFVNPYPWSVPGSTRTAFLRTMNFISKWDWRSEPLVVGMNGEDMSGADTESIETRFNAWRKIDPAMNRVVMFAASNLDHDGLTWTEHGPSKVVAGRFTLLARAAMGVLKEQGLDVEAQSLFVTSLEDYDFVIYLQPEILGHFAKNRSSKTSFKNLQTGTVKDRTLIGYDPMQLYFEELKRLFEDSVILFRSGILADCPIIAGVWNVQARSRAWKTNLPYSSIPNIEERDDSEESQTASTNRSAILNDIVRLGGEMVSRIQAKE